LNLLGIALELYQIETLACLEYRGAIDIAGAGERSSQVRLNKEICLIGGACNVLIAIILIEKIFKNGAIHIVKVLVV
jgi:hypothetical protein